MDLIYVQGFMCILPFLYLNISLSFVSSILVKKWRKLYSSCSRRQAASRRHETERNQNILYLFWFVWKCSWFFVSFSLSVSFEEQIFVKNTHIVYDMLAVLIYKMYWHSRTQWHTHWVFIYIHTVNWNMFWPASLLEEEVMMTASIFILCYLYYPY